MRKKQIAALGMAAALIATSISPVNVMKVSAAGKNLKITKSMVKKGKFVVPKGTYQNITIDKNVDGASVVLKNVNVKKTIVVNGKGKKAITLNVKADTKVNKITVNAKKSAVVVGSKGSVKNLVSNAADMKLSGEGKVSNVKLNAKNQSVNLDAGKITTTDKATASINYVDVKGKSEVKLGDFTEVTNVVDGKDQKISYDKDGQEVKSALSYEGYTEKWRDDFNGNKLDRKNWNVELHEPGWVNNELQEYVDSDKNIIVKDGKLILKAIKTKDKDGKVSYTSGRINTKGNQDYKYGIFEADIKFPKGQGFFPAFWMMPTDESLYGQWPKCGEIDITEVLGHDTKKAYSTVHYGVPHKENQGTRVLNNCDFSKEFHKFSCKWEPGKLTWYIDGNQIYETSEWCTKEDGGNEVTYPAPFDQPFHVILNLAVGGNWEGDPAEDTNFDKETLMVDSVRIYQKDAGYDENVEKPVKEVQLREPNADGNYINNGDFAVAEDLADGDDWQFMTALGGEAEASVTDGQLKIATANAGTVDYSVQFVQANIPMKKGGTYKVSFDAYADEARTMKIGISAPDKGYIRYFDDTVVELATEKKTYTYDFTMKEDDDANGRLEFNLGNMGSTAAVYIDNVRIEKTGEISADEFNKKKALPDGNYVYNGKFQEGEGRLGFWNVSEGSKVYVTNILEETGKTGSEKYSVIRKLVADGNVVLSQKDLALQTDTDYALSFKAGAVKESTVKVSVSGKTVKEVKIPASADGQLTEYTENFKTAETLENKDLKIEIISDGEVYLDDVSIVENAMIKNGKFSADFAGFETFADGSAAASFSIDELNNGGNKTATVEITNSSDQEWKIQLKQTGVKLEKGKTYKLSFKAKSTLDRTIQYALQRDGSVHKDANGGEDWTTYTQQTVEINGEYQTIENIFTMTEDSDNGTIFNIAMGKGGKEGSTITEKHVVSIDDIVLVEVAEAAK